MLQWFVSSQGLEFEAGTNLSVGRKIAFLNSRLSFRLILECKQQQPKSETAKAAIEKIRRKS